MTGDTREGDFLRQALSIAVVCKGGNAGSIMGGAICQSWGDDREAGLFFDVVKKTLTLLFRNIK